VPADCGGLGQWRSAPMGRIDPGRKGRIREKRSRAPAWSASRPRKAVRIGKFLRSGQTRLLRPTPT